MVFGTSVPIRLNARAHDLFLCPFYHHEKQKDMNRQEQIAIALIDDQEQFRNRIGKLLEISGFRVLIQAENGSVALEKLQKATILPDVCITDVHMPVMNGFETTKVLRKHYPGLKILGYSINADASVIIEMLRCGANGFTTKGSRVRELKEAISRIYYEGVYFSSASGKILLEQLRKSC